MEYNFHPFVDPSNTGSIFLPDFSTQIEKREIDITPGKKEESESLALKWPKDLNIDFNKLEKSKGRQIKDGTGYTHSEVNDFKKVLKRAGFNIDTKSKNSIIESILALKKYVNL